MEADEKPPSIGQRSFQVAVKQEQEPPPEEIDAPDARFQEFLMMAFEPSPSIKTKAERYHSDDEGAPADLQGPSDAHEFTKTELTLDEEFLSDTNDSNSSPGPRESNRSHGGSELCQYIYTQESFEVSKDFTETELTLDRKFLDSKNDSNSASCSQANNQCVLEAPKTQQVSASKPALNMETCNLCPNLIPKECMEAHMIAVHHGKRLQCEFCPRSFMTKGTLTRHNKTCKGAHITETSCEELYRCEICQRTFKSVMSLKRHMHTHEENRPRNYACGQCEAKYMYKGDLNRHLNTHNKERKYPCNLCDKVFCSSVGLLFHVRRHIGETYNCELCGARFPDRSQLERHVPTCKLRRHLTGLHKMADKAKQELNKFVCEAATAEECSIEVELIKYTTTEVDLSHLDDELLAPDPQQPNDANKFTKTELILDEEFLSDDAQSSPGRRENNKCLLSHTGRMDREFSVSKNDSNSASCSQANNQSVLEAAKSQEVSSVKPMSNLENCKVCLKVVPKESLEAHMTEVHHGNIYECEFCPRTFKTFGYLRRHSMTCNRVYETYDCGQCEAKYLDKSELERHLNSHAKQKKYPCHLCDKIYYSSSGLLGHVRRHTGEVYNCARCRARFPDKQQLEAHVSSCKYGPDKKRFKCTLCSKHYANKYILQQHYKYHTGLPWKCSICERAFIDKAKARAHLTQVHKMNDKTKQELNKFVCEVAAAEEFSIEMETVKSTTTEVEHSHSEMEASDAQHSIPEISRQNEAELPHNEEVKAFAIQFSRPESSTPNAAQLLPNVEFLGDKNADFDSNARYNPLLVFEIDGDQHPSIEVKSAETCEVLELTRNPQTQNDDLEAVDFELMLDDMRNSISASSSRVTNLHGLEPTDNQKPRVSISLEDREHGQEIFSKESRRTANDFTKTELILDEAFSETKNISDSTSSSRRTNMHDLEIADEQQAEENRRRNYACGQCESTFLDTRSLDRHLTTHSTTERKHSCELCGACFLEKAAMESHVLSCNKDGTSRKDRYERRLRDKEHASEAEGCDSDVELLETDPQRPNDAHEFTKTELTSDEEFLSDTNDSDSSPGMRESNVLSHEGSELGHGIYTQESFETSSINPNITEASCGELYRCEICQRKFQKEESLKRHMHTHEDNRPGNYACEHCEAKYIYKSDLNRHLNTHTKQKKYPCNLCDKILYSFSGFLGHVGRHTGETYNCERCGARFPDKIELERHVPSCKYAPNKTRFKCTLCCKDYGRIYDLKRHYKYHYGLPWKCSICGKEFLLAARVRRHLSYVHKMTDKTEEELNKFVREATGNKPPTEMEPIKSTTTEVVQDSHSEEGVCGTQLSKPEDSTPNEGELLQKEEAEAFAIQLSKPESPTPNVTQLSQDEEVTDDNIPGDLDSNARNSPLLVLEVDADKQASTTVMNDENNEVQQSTRNLRIQNDDLAAVDFELMLDDMPNSVSASSSQTTKLHGLDKTDNQKPRVSISLEGREHCQEIFSKESRGTSNDFTKTELILDEEFSDTKNISDSTSTSRRTSVHDLEIADEQQAEENRRRNYACGQCESTFLDTRSLDRHRTTHSTTERKHSCELCGACFLEKAAMESHVLSCNKYGTSRKDRYGRRLRDKEHANEAEGCDSDDELLGTDPQIPNDAHEFTKTELILDEEFLPVTNDVESKSNGCRELGHSIYTQESFETSRDPTETESALDREFSDSKNDSNSASCSQANNQSALETTKSQEVSSVKPMSNLENCKVCLKVVPTECLEAHMTEVHRGNIYQCESCPRKFKSFGFLRRHSMTCNRVYITYDCGQCEAKYLDKSELERHLNIHTKQKKYPCNLCDKIYYSSAGLRNHVRLHTGEIYDCERCRARFPDKLQLEGHVSSCKYGPNKTRYKCTLCCKDYASQKVLKRHYKSHNGLPWKCSICERGFLEKAKVCTHLTQVHKMSDTTEQELNKFVCEVAASEEFSTEMEPKRPTTTEVEHCLSEAEAYDAQHSIPEASRPNEAKLLQKEEAEASVIQLSKPESPTPNVTQLSQDEEVPHENIAGDLDPNARNSPLLVPQIDGDEQGGISVNDENNEVQQSTRNPRIQNDDLAAVDFELMLDGMPNSVSASSSQSTNLHDLDKTDNQKSRVSILLEDCEHCQEIYSKESRGTSNDFSKSELILDEEFSDTKNISDSNSTSRRTSVHDLEIAEEQQAEENSRRNYACGQCESTFLDMRSLDRHRTTHSTTERKHACELCGACFLEKAAMESHVLSCNKDGRRLRDKEHASEAEVSCSNELRIGCDSDVELLGTDPQRPNDAHEFTKTELTSDEEFLSDTNDSDSSPGMRESNVLSHEGSELGHGIYTQESFETSSINPNITEASCGELYRCEICQRKFQKEESLKRHMHTHEDNRPGNYACEHCEAKYLYKNHLNRHLNTHTKEKKYPCNLCNKILYSSGSLHLHVKRHTDETYDCERCRARFPDKIQLERHLPSCKYASHKTRYKCTLCCKDYARKRDLKRHYQYHYGLPWKCAICERGFVLPVRVRIHLSYVHKMADKTEEELNKFVCEAPTGNNPPTEMEPIKSTTTEVGQDSHSEEEACGAQFSKTETSTPNEAELSQMEEAEAFAIQFSKPKSPTPNVTQLSPDEEVIDDNNAGEGCHSDDELLKTDPQGPNNAHEFTQTKLTLDEEFLSDTNDLDSSPGMRESNVLSHGSSERGHGIYTQESFEASKDFTENSASCSQVNNQRVLETAQQVNPVKPTLKMKTCKLCSKVFPKECMEAHLTEVHQGKRLQCGFCPRSFKSKGNLMRHNMICKGEHVTETSYERCEICKRNFTTKISLTRHMRIHGENRTRNYGCGQCGAKFLDKAVLKGHLNTHTKKNKYPCHLCDKIFLSATGLLVHTRRHRGETYNCERCGARFLDKSQLDSHVPSCKYVPNKKRYKCTLCGEDYARQSNLKLHYKYHNGWPWKCSICGTGFAERARVRQHLTGLHKISGKTKEELNKFVFEGPTGNNPSPEVETIKSSTTEVEHSNTVAETLVQQCTRNSQTPNDSDNSEKELMLAEEFLDDKNDSDSASSYRRTGLHVLEPADDQRAEDHRPRNYVCGQCESTFFDMRALDRHLITHKINKKGKYSCRICGKVFSSSSYLNTHMSRHKTHGTYFPKKAALENHVLSCNNDGTSKKDRYECRLCDKVLSICRLRRHLIQVHKLVDTTQEELDKFVCEAAPAEEPSIEMEPLISTPTEVEDSHIGSKDHGTELYTPELSTPDQAELPQNVEAEAFAIQLSRPESLTPNAAQLPQNQEFLGGNNTDFASNARNNPLLGLEIEGDRRANIVVESTETYEVQQLTRNQQTQNDDLAAVDFELILDGMPNSLSASSSQITHSLETPAYQKPRVSISQEKFTETSNYFDQIELILDEEFLDTNNDSQSASCAPETYPCGPEIADNQQGSVSITAQDSIMQSSMVRPDHKKTFNCEMCPNTFVRKYALLKHMKCHDVNRTGKPFHKVIPKRLRQGKGTFDCRFCEKTYSYKENLKRHMLLHAGDTHKYTCDLCGAGYVHQRTLRQHLVQWHSNESSSQSQRYKCKHCDKEFGHRYLLYQHSKEHTRMPWKCRLCGKKLSKKKLIRSHLAKAHNMTGKTPKKLNNFVCEAAKAELSSIEIEPIKSTTTEIAHSHSEVEAYGTQHPTLEESRPNQAELPQKEKAEAFAIQLSRPELPAPNGTQLPPNVEFLGDKHTDFAPYNPLLGLEIDGDQHASIIVKSTETYEVQQSTRNPRIQNDDLAAVDFELMLDGMPNSVSASSSQSTNLHGLDKTDNQKPRVTISLEDREHCQEILSKESMGTSNDFTKTELILDDEFSDTKNISDSTSSSRRTSIHDLEIADEQQAEENRRRNYACGQCESTFLDTRSLDRHRTTHSTTERKHSCELCGACFLEKAAMESHVLSCNKDGTFRKDRYERRHCDKDYASEAEVGHSDDELLTTEPQGPSDAHEFTKTELTSDEEFLSDTNDSNSSPGHRESNKCLISHGGSQLGHGIYTQESFEASKDFTETQLTLDREFSDTVDMETCKLCLNVVPKDCMEAHMTEMHNGKRLQCEFCPRSFMTKVTLKRHNKTCKGAHTTETSCEELYRCEICQRKFTTKMALTRHMHIHEENRPRNYACGQCEAKFLEKTALERHLNIHTKEKKYPCHLCHKIFYRSSSLLSHVRTHTGETFNCDQCGPHFPNKIQWERHANCSKHVVTPNKKRYKCTLCGKDYANEPLLKRHYKYHNGLPWKCSICPTRFDGRANGRTHLTHVHKMTDKTKEELNKLICKAPKANESTIEMERMTSTPTEAEHSHTVGESLDVQQSNQNPQIPNDSKESENEQFLHDKNDSDSSSSSRRTNLQDLEKADDQQAEDNRPRNYACGQCNTKFLDMRALEKHLTTHMDRIFACRLCQKKFYRKSFLAHAREHIGKTHDCERCGARFLEKTALESHLLSCNRDGTSKKDRYDCRLCDKDYATEYQLKMHYKFHTGLPWKWKCSICAKEFIEKSRVRRHLSHVHKMTGKTTEELNTFVCEVFAAYDSLIESTASTTTEAEHSYNEAEPYGTQLSTPKAKKPNEAKLPHDKNGADFDSNARGGPQSAFDEQQVRITIGAKNTETYELLKPTRQLQTANDAGDAEACLDHKNEADSTFSRRTNVDTTEKQQAGHIKSREENRPHSYSCGHCESKFLDIRAAIRHRSTHRERKFACRICRKVFYSSSALLVHVGLHTGKTNDCKRCGASFLSKASLEIHMICCNYVGTSKKKRYECTLCDKDFVSEFGLRQHYKFHTGLPWKCGICTKPFITKYVVRNHLAKVHKLTGKTQTELDKFVCKAATTEESSIQPMKSTTIEHSHSEVEAYGTQDSTTEESRPNEAELPQKEEAEAIAIQLSRPESPTPNAAQLPQREEILDCNVRYNPLLVLKKDGDQQASITVKNAETYEVQQLTRNPQTQNDDLKAVDFELMLGGMPNSLSALSSQITHSLETPAYQQPRASISQEDSALGHEINSKETMEASNDFAKTELILDEEFLDTNNDSQSASCAPETCPCDSELAEDQQGSVSITAQDSVSIESSMVRPVHKKTFNCEICPNTFERKYALLKHMRCHDVNRAGMPFHRSIPQNRQKMHAKRERNGKGKFDCRFCEKTFSYKEDLKRHMLLHAGDTHKYNCDMCGVGYVHHRTLRQHLVRFHSNESSSQSQRYKCTDCDKEFGHRYLLYQHSKEHIAMPWNCRLCGKKLPKKKLLREHFRRFHKITDTSELNKMAQEVATEIEAMQSTTTVVEYSDISTETKACGIQLLTPAAQISNSPELPRDEQLLGGNNAADIGSNAPYSLLDAEQHNIACIATQSTETYEVHKSNQKPLTPKDATEDTETEFMFREELLDDKNCSSDLLSHAQEYQGGVQVLADEQKPQQVTETCKLCYKCFPKEEFENHMSQAHCQGASQHQVYPVHFDEQTTVIKTELIFDEEFLDDKNNSDSFSCSQAMSQSVLEPVSSEQAVIAITHEDSEFCNKSYEEIDLTHPSGSHDDNPPRNYFYECDQCDSKFSAVRRLEIHLNAHAKEKRSELACQLCKSRFKNLSCLSMHMNKHIGDSSNCGLCGRHFSFKPSLKSHMLRCSGEASSRHRWYKCMDCGKKYENRQLFDKHRKLENCAAWNCHYCQTKFTHMSSCKRHIVRTHQVDKEKAAEFMHKVPKSKKSSTEIQPLQSITTEEDDPKTHEDNS